MCPGTDWGRPTHNCIEILCDFIIYFYLDLGMFNDLGVYGVPGPVKRKERFDAVSAMRKMEKYHSFFFFYFRLCLFSFRYSVYSAVIFIFRFTRDVGGYPFLYADIFMDRKEFEEMFDLVAYERARKKYHAIDAFPHLYDKVLFT